MMKNFIVWVGGLFLSASAFAYVPPPSFIINHMLKERPKLHSLEMEGKVTQLDAKWSGKETLKVDFSMNRMLAVYTNEKGEVLGQKVSKISDSAPLGQAWIELGMDPGMTRVKAVLNDLRLDLTEVVDVKLTRNGTKVLWSWGKDNVLSILQDEFLVMGLLVGANDGAERSSEFRVEEYSATSNGVMVPRSVLIKRAGKDVYRYELKGFKVNANVKDVAGASSDFSSGRAGVFKEWVELVR